MSVPFGLYLAVVVALTVALWVVACQRDRARAELGVMRAVERHRQESITDGSGALGGHRG